MMHDPGASLPRECGGVPPISVVIPGRRKAASPESITTIESMDSGLAPGGAPRNDKWGSDPPLRSRSHRPSKVNL